MAVLRCASMLAPLASLVVGACATEPPPESDVRVVEDSRGRAALEEAEQSAADADGDADAAAAVLDDEGDEAEAWLDDALAGIAEGRASLEEAARYGACACRLDELAAAIEQGDDDLVPVQAGCQQRSDDAVLLSSEAEPGVCEELAHELGDLEELVRGLFAAEQAYDDAAAACDEAYAAADANVDALVDELEPACAGDDAEACDRALVEHQDAIDLLYSEANEICLAAVEAAEQP